MCLKKYPPNARMLNHNIETVPRLYLRVRPQADYQRSLQLIQKVGEMDAHMASKSGLMLGLGETHEEVLRVLQDLLTAGCKLLTLGQYLAPSKDHHPIVEYVPPDQFSKWEESAYEMGFQGVASGPFVRSSFHAGEMFMKTYKTWCTQDFFQG